MQVEPDGPEMEREAQMHFISLSPRDSLAVRAIRDRAFDRRVQGLNQGYEGRTQDSSQSEGSSLKTHMEAR